MVYDLFEQAQDEAYQTMPFIYAESKEYLNGESPLSFPPAQSFLIRSSGASLHMRRPFTKSLKVAGLL